MRRRELTKAEIRAHIWMCSEEELTEIVNEALLARSRRFPKDRKRKRKGKTGPIQFTDSEVSALNNLTAAVATKFAQRGRKAKQDEIPAGGASGDLAS